MEQVISSVEELAEVSERMIRFMKETAMEGYYELLSTSDGYYNDVDDIYKIIEKFAQESVKFEQSVDYIKEAIQAVGIAVEENSKGIISTAEMASNLASNVEHIEQTADTNMQIAERLEEEVGKFKAK